jgi:cysteine desulfurase / selenocysteine lyase
MAAMVSSTGIAQGLPLEGARRSRWRADFPALRGVDVAYLDGAAMPLRPQAVIDAVTGTYSGLPANVHRGQYAWAQATTVAYEDARERVARRLNALSREIVFSASCTHSINIVAHGLGLPPDAEVLVPVLEHHSNHLPWTRVARVRPIGLSPGGLIDLDRLEDAIGPKTAVIAFTLASNVTGAIQPAAEIVALARKHGLLTVVDGAQAVPHLDVDVESLGADFLAFSGYKLFGPSGIGVLWGCEERLRSLAPWATGGGMVDRVADPIVYYEGYRRFEAGTPNIEGAIGLSAAIDYAASAGRTATARHTHELSTYLHARLDAVADLVRPIFPPSRESVPIVTLVPRKNTLGTMRLAAILSDTYGVAVREGVHCCQPLFDSVGTRESIRVSLQSYNELADVDRLIASLEDVRPLFN